MNLTCVLRPAQKILAGTAVAAVASTCIISGATSTSASHSDGPASVQAKKEYRIGTAKKEYAPAKKEYVVTPAKKEYAPAKKEYVVTPAKKEYAPAKKEYVVTPAKKEYAPAKKEYVVLVAQKASPALSSHEYRRRVRQRINAIRAAHRLGHLTPASCTHRVASRWSRHLAATDGFYHQSMTKLLRTCDAHYVGETLGRGAMTPATLVTMWMHSPPHRHILLSHNPRRIGLGATVNSRGEWVVAANFMRF